MWEGQDDQGGREEQNQGRRVGGVGSGREGQDQGRKGRIREGRAGPGRIREGVGSGRIREGGAGSGREEACIELTCKGY